MKRIALVMASLVTGSLFALMWVGAASADVCSFETPGCTYTPIQITQAGINDEQYLAVTYTTPAQGVSQAEEDWDVWTPDLNAWSIYDTTGGSSVGTVTASVTSLSSYAQLPPQDANATKEFAVQVQAWDPNCTYPYNGTVQHGCTNYSAWAYFNLAASCTQNITTPGHYVITRKGHYLKKHGHYVYVTRHHRRVRVWIKPVRRWVAPVYGDPTCIWVNS